MVKPNNEKDLKQPQAEGAAKDKDKDKDQGGNNTSRVLIMNILTTTIICGLFLAGNYFIQDLLLTKKMAATQTEEEQPAEGEENVAEERGIIVDLGDFTMNLSDTDSRRYLKVSVALELTKKPEDDQVEKPKGGHGEGAPAASPVETEMAQFKPAIRDAIISSLSSKTSAELSTTSGKELAKDEITDSVDSILGGDREVIRVSFGQFIMQ